MDYSPYIFAFHKIVKRFYETHFLYVFVNHGKISYAMFFVILSA